MKSTKKLLALVLAMMMALSVMAMTAAAYEAEEHVHDETCCEAEPRYVVPGVACPNCRAQAQAVPGLYVDGKQVYECTAYCGYGYFTF